MKPALDTNALNQLFFDARSYNGWQGDTIAKETLEMLWNLTRMGPTSANSSPMRLIFVITPEAKEKLKPCLIDSNVEKAMTAPAIAIIAYDVAFIDKLPQLFPHADARSWFEGNDLLITETAFRNGTLQGAYLMLAARALGLDCGPMSGFDNASVDTAFLPVPPLSLIFFAASGSAIGRQFLSVARASTSMKPVRSPDGAGFCPRHLNGRLFGGATE